MSIDARTAWPQQRIDWSTYEEPDMTDQEFADRVSADPDKFERGCDRLLEDLSGESVFEVSAELAEANARMVEHVAARVAELEAQHQARKGRREVALAVGGALLVGLLFSLALMLAGCGS